MFKLLNKLFFLCLILFFMASFSLVEARVGGGHTYSGGNKTNTYKPSTSTYKPSTNTYKPSTNTYKPSTNTYKPSTNTYKPSTNTYKPSTNYNSNYNSSTNYNHNTHTSSTYESSGQSIHLDNDPVADLMGAFYIFLGIVALAVVYMILQIIFDGARKTLAYSVGTKESTGYTNQYYSPPGNMTPYNPSKAYEPAAPRPFQPQRKLFPATKQIKAYQRFSDSNFSRTLFMDFIHLLYTKVQIARGTGNWAELTPYITASIIKFYTASLKASSVENVVVGSAKIIGIMRGHKGYDKVKIEFEANYKETKTPGSNPVVYYIKEVWTLRRKPGVLSKGPEYITSFNCPSCGGPVDIAASGECAHCGEVVTRGDFHWQLYHAGLAERKPREPIHLGGAGGGGVEPGFNRADVFSPDFNSEKRGFLIRYPEFSLPEFQKKAIQIFHKLQEAWSSGDWEKARAFQTDYLFSSHKYWMDWYRDEGLKNCLEQIKVLSVRPVKIERDAFYESITVRIKASMIDYTVDRTGSVADGSKGEARKFSEYWTFIRRGGFAGEKKKKSIDECPGCGAKIKINMAGVCEYCDKKITSGNFDWVLASIEQDEVYEG